MSLVLKGMKIQEILEARKLNSDWKSRADDEIIHRHAVLFGQVDKSIEFRIKDLKLRELKEKLSPGVFTLDNENARAYGLAYILDPENKTPLWKYAPGIEISVSRIQYALSFDPLATQNYLSRLIEASPRDEVSLKVGYYKYLDRLRTELTDGDIEDIIDDILSTAEAQEYLKKPHKISGVLEQVLSRADVPKSNIVDHIQFLNKREWDTSVIINMINSEPFYQYGMGILDDGRLKIKAEMKRIEGGLSVDEKQSLWSYYYKRCSEEGLDPDHDIYRLHEGGLMDRVLIMQSIQGLLSYNEVPETFSAIEKWLLDYITLCKNERDSRGSAGLINLIGKKAHERFLRIEGMIKWDRNNRERIHGGRYLSMNGWQDWLNSNLLGKIDPIIVMNRTGWSLKDCVLVTFGAEEQILHQFNIAPHVM